MQNLLLSVLISVSGGLFSWLDGRHSASRLALSRKKAQWRRELGRSWCHPMKQGPKSVEQVIHPCIVYFAEKKKLLDSTDDV